MSSAPRSMEAGGSVNENAPNKGDVGNTPGMNGQQPSVEGEGRGKKKAQFHGRGKGIGAVPKGRGSQGPGWTGAGFDVDGRT